jgi:acetyl-CoA synthetase
MHTPSEQIRAARDFLLAHRTDYETAYAKFTWPRPATFNFAVDWFDAVLAAEHPDRVALRLIEEDGRDANATGIRVKLPEAQAGRGYHE